MGFSDCSTSAAVVLKSPLVMGEEGRLECFSNAFCRRRLAIARHAVQQDYEAFALTMYNVDSPPFCS
jgi:hypothetical protein